jgi:hypothetical protein
MSNRAATDTLAQPGREANLRWAVRQIEESLRSLRFGSITLVVQDGVIVQVDRVVKTRYPRGEEGSNAAL